MVYTGEAEASSFLELGALPTSGDASPQARGQARLQARRPAKNRAYGGPLMREIRGPLCGALREPYMKNVWCTPYAHLR